MKEIDRIYVCLKSIDAIYRKYEELKILISREEEKGHSRRIKVIEMEEYTESLRVLQRDWRR